MITNILIQSHKSPFGLKLTLIFPESEVFNASSAPEVPQFWPNIGLIHVLFSKNTKFPFFKFKFMTLAKVT